MFLDLFVRYERGGEWITKGVFVSRSQLLRGNSQIPRVSWQNNHHHKLFVFCLTPFLNALCFPRQDESDGESTACKLTKKGAQ